MAWLMARIWPDARPAKFGPENVARPSALTQVTMPLVYYWFGEDMGDNTNVPRMRGEHQSFIQFAHAKKRCPGLT